MLAIRKNMTNKNIAARVIAVLIMIVLAMGLSGCSLKPAENQTLNIDGIQVHIESNGKISQNKVDEFIEAVRNQPDYLKKNCENIYLMRPSDFNSKYKEKGGKDTSLTLGFTDDNNIYINSSIDKYQDTTTHELWHVYDFSRNNNGIWMTDYDINIQNLYNIAPQSLTQHGSENVNEFFAEAGAMYVNSPNELKEANMDVYNYFEALPKE